MKVIKFHNDIMRNQLQSLLLSLQNEVKTEILNGEHFWDNNKNATHVVPTVFVEDY